QECSSPATPTDKQEPPKKDDQSPVGSVAADGQKWGNVKGQIVWAGGDVPERKPIDPGTNKDAAVCQANGKLLSDEWLTNPANKGIQCTFVWLAPEPDAPKGTKLPIHPDLREVKQKQVFIDQPCCKF